MKHYAAIASAALLLASLSGTTLAQTEKVPSTLDTGAAGTTSTTGTTTTTTTSTTSTE